MSKGFTLIELLIVVSIIGVLSVAGTIIYRGVNEDSKDKIRLRDLGTIKQSLELFNYDQRYYPKDLNQLVLSTSGNKKYLDPIPLDPQSSSGKNYVYSALPSTCTAANKDCTGFAICAKKSGSRTYDLPSVCSSLICAGTDGACDMGVASDNYIDTPVTTPTPIAIVTVPSLMFNGNFESANFDGWFCRGTSGEIMTCPYSTIDKYEGLRSMRLENIGGVTAATQSIGLGDYLAGPQPYCLSVSSRTYNLTDGSARVLIHGYYPGVGSPDDTEEIIFPVSANWVRKTYDLMIDHRTGGQRNIELVFRGRSTFLDDVSFTRGACPSTTHLFSRVFVTDTAYNVPLNGLAGADLKCQVSADEVHIGGTWKAWLSDSVTNAASRLVPRSVPYQLLDGTKIANNWTDLTDGTLLAPISKSETQMTLGGKTWTGTNGSGLKKSSNRIDFCNDWTTTTNSSNGYTGYSGDVNSQWTDRAQTGCFEPARLYCIEQ